MGRALFLVLLAVVLALAGLALIPGRIDPAAWQPPKAPSLDGAFTPNQRLRDADLLAVGMIDGPEDVAVDREGRIYGGTQDGRIMRIESDGSVTVFAETGGRPLGLHFDAGGRLIVADAWRGLLSVASDGGVSVLATEAGGVPFGFTDDLDIARDGTIYFSDASSRFGQDEYVLDLLEMRPHGRLLAYSPATGETRVLLDGLYFANGVALSSGEDFLLVNETWAYRIQRYWLKGPAAGTAEIFVENLPGFPDGVSGNRAGRFWVAFPTPRLASVDRAHPHPWMKRIIARLPDFLKPRPVEYGFVAALDEDGRVLASYHDPDGSHLREITSAEEHDGQLYLGTLHNDRIGRLDVSEAP